MQQTLTKKLKVHFEKSVSVESKRALNGDEFSFAVSKSFQGVNGCEGSPDYR